MGFSRISLTNVRNLRAVDLRALGGVNVFHGANGSGKTSLLEGIYLLGVARSFRTHQIRHVIQHGEQACTAFGEWHAGSNGEGRAVPVGVPGTSMERFRFVLQVTTCVPFQSWRSWSRCR